MADEVNVLALVKGEERFVLLYDDANKDAALRTLGRWASNPDLSFTWYDAAVLSDKVRKADKAAAKPRAAPSPFPKNRLC